MTSVLNQDNEKGNILVFGIGTWFVVLALAFAVMAAADLYADKRDLMAEADYIALSLADDIDSGGYYEGVEDFSLSREELSHKAGALTRHDTDIVDISILDTKTVQIQLRRRVSVFTLPAFTDIGIVELQARSTAYLRDYRSP